MQHRKRQVPCSAPRTTRTRSRVRGVCTRSAWLFQGHDVSVSRSGVAHVCGVRRAPWAYPGHPADAAAVAITTSLQHHCVSLSDANPSAVPRPYLDPRERQGGGRGVKARGTRAGCVAAGLLETLPLPLRFVQRRWFGFSLLRPVPRFPRTDLVGEAGLGGA